jgi:hypothetical protein
MLIKMLEENKKKIITFAVIAFTSTVVCVGIYLKYLKKEPKSEKSEPKENVESTKKEEKNEKIVKEEPSKQPNIEKKEEFIPAPEVKFISHPLPSNEGENKTFFKSFSISSNPLSNALHDLKIQNLTEKIAPMEIYSVNSNQTVEECIQVFYISI